ncbi:hypothetical protein IWW36_000745 [Coemansia brasiliensis]|uniref:Uncharacterized protein n=1 Tax=Coemansia brasiliensis TaxID=2650707 RepID=A0A9W8IFD8_9FUNG|nr:hypothetical protein IWW36_000745 [Coemansia brasiliensis]
MYNSQQASYKAIPSSTRSRRVSSNHSTRPALQQADYGHTSSPGITLQSWARSHVQQPADQRRAQAETRPSTAMYQAQYHFTTQQQNSRPQSSGRDSEQMRFAVADYFDPYQNPSRGQTLNVDAAPVNKAPLQKPRNAGPQTPPSPVMRAVRHSQPTTPNGSSALGPSGSHESLSSKQQQQRHFKAPTQFPPPAELSLVDSGFARTKPRAYTSSDSPPSSPSALFAPRKQMQTSPTRPRVSSMYVDSTSTQPSAHLLRAEVGHTSSAQQRVSSAATPQVRGVATSELANAAIREFVDIKSQQVKKTAAHTQPWPVQADSKKQGPATPTSSYEAPKIASAAPLGISAERSHIIEFIERQRARTMAATLPQPAPNASQAGRTSSNAPPDSKGSDTSERSFKRSTARLAEVNPALLKKSNDNLPSSKAASWYPAPTRTSSAAYDSSPGFDPAPRISASATHAMHHPPLPSTRIVPRTRAQTVAEEAVQQQQQQPFVLTHARIPNKPESRLARRSNDALPKPYSRHSRPSSSSGVAPSTSTASMQTNTLATRSCGVQTPKNTIHSDEAVLDLMRQMDVLRQGHANQISEYQEQVIDLELMNQDLTSEIEQLTAHADAKEAAHKQFADDMRGKLEQANMRVNREIDEMKSMHAAKCDELTAQISTLLNRCEAYKHKLEALGVDERELLSLAVEHAKEPQSDMEITDQAFIESQYVETRDSSIEADYFKQLMDIERSMENTTIALGFELKRTQAKYLQQAADFIREQMTRIQTDRPDSRLTLRRSDSRATVSIRSPTLDTPSPDPASANLSGSQSPVQSLAASLTQLSKSHPLPPLPPSISNIGRSQQQQPAAKHSTGPVNYQQQGSDTQSPAVTRHMSVSDALGILRHPAALPAFSESAVSQLPPSPPAATSTQSSSAHGFDSQDRASGLSQAMEATPDKFPSSAASSHSSLPSEAVSDSMTDLFVLSSGSSRRAHRSPLAGIAGGFFSSSQESMSTAVALSETTTSSTSLPVDSHPLHSSQPNVTPTRASKPPISGSLTDYRSSKGSSIGYFSGHRRYLHDSAESLPSSHANSKSASMHWPPRSERKSRPQSVVDSQDMTAEQLLESLKLPSTGALGITTPTRNSGSYSSSPSSSLGRRSPLPRSGSALDFNRTLPAPRFSSEKPPFEQTSNHFASQKLSSSVRSYVFDPNAEINIDLGLGPTGNNSSRRFKRTGPRRRSRSVGAWGMPLN